MSMKKVMMDTRKLYQVRHTVPGHTFGQTVGYKAQLKPRAAAARIAKRLRAAGIDARISPILVNVTPVQAAYLDRRYAPKHPTVANAWVRA